MMAAYSRAAYSQTISRQVGQGARSSEQEGEGVIEQGKGSDSDRKGLMSME